MNEFNEIEAAFADIARQITDDIEVTARVDAMTEVLVGIAAADYAVVVETALAISKVAAASERSRGQLVVAVSLVLAKLVTAASPHSPEEDKYHRGAMANLLAQLVAADRKGVNARKK